MPGGQRYSEAHHIRPLGDLHRGNDVKENIVILCPNHHAEFDYVATTIEPETLKIISYMLEKNQGTVIKLHKKHTLGIDDLRYSYMNIFSKKLKDNYV